MSTKKDRLKKQADYWRISADKNWKIAKALFKLKHYDGCLFYCHLALEKLLKGLVVIKIKKPAPYKHDLAELANIANLKLSKEEVEELRILSTFNIFCRYDNTKFDFYKLCTKEYSEKYFKISNKKRLWLKKQYPKK